MTPNPNRSPYIEDRRFDPPGAQRMAGPTVTGYGDATFKRPMDAPSLPYEGDDYYSDNGPGAVRASAQQPSAPDIARRRDRALALARARRRRAEQASLTPPGEQMSPRAPRAITAQEFDQRFDPTGGKQDFGPMAPGVAKPPQALAPEMGWGEVAGSAVSNLGPSAVRFGGDMANIVMHPLETATNLVNLGLGVAQKLIPGEQGNEQYADALGKFFADRYGGMDQLKNTMATDPVGFLADVSTVLSGGSLAAARAPGMVGTVSRVAGSVGRAVDPLNAAAKAVTATGRGVGKLASAGLGVTTGAGSLPVQMAARAGYRGGQAAEAFRNGMRGDVPMESVITEAKSAVEAIRRERKVAYESGMAALAQDQRVLDFGKIDRALATAKPVKQFRGISLQPSAAKTTQEVAEVLDQWRKLPPEQFHTPEGFDALKQRIGDIVSNTEPGSPSRAIATQVYNLVKDQIVKQAPVYSGTMKGYQEASELIREIESTLSLGGKARIDTSLRKLQSVMRNNVNANYGRRLDIVKLLENAGASHLLEKLAGQAMNTLEPRGLARLGAAGLSGTALLAFLSTLNPSILIGLLGQLATSSPRLVGEAAFAAGKVARGAAKAWEPARTVLQLSYQGRGAEPATPRP